MEEANMMRLDREREWMLQLMGDLGRMKGYKCCKEGAEK